MGGGDHLVLGAGCAGLSLAAALVRVGATGSITVVDARARFTRDRTWCTWQVGAHLDPGAEVHRWHRWEVVTHAGRAEQRTHRHPYVELDALRVYDRLLDELDAAPSVEVRLGERVLAAAERGGRAVARTAAGELEARHGWEARGLGAPGLRAADVGCWQRFLGQEVEVDRPAFDPGLATLMDFRTSQADGVSFLYVLPRSPTRALVEHTTFGASVVPPDRRRAAIARYLGEQLGVRAEHLHREEVGAVPMAVGLPTHADGPWTPIGLAGGAARPSSGYAFGRIQSQVARQAAGVAAGRARRSSDGLRGGRQTGLDRVFLRVLSDAPHAFPEHLRRLVAGCPADAFARFMVDASSVRDDLRIMRALPVAPYAGAALREARASLRTPGIAVRGLASASTA